MTSRSQRTICGKNIQGRVNNKHKDLGVTSGTVSPLREKMMQDGNSSQRLRHGTCHRPGSLEMRPETQSLGGSKLKSTCTQEKPVRGEKCGIWNGEKLDKWFTRCLVSIRPPRGALGLELHHGGCPGGGRGLGS